MRSFFQVCCCALLLTFTTSRICRAQSSAGVILGEITDQSGGVIPGAHIVIRNTGTNAEVRFETDASGNYYVPSLIPGVYAVEAEKQGFEKIAAPHVVVEVNQVVRIDLRLRLGQTNQEIQVQATTSLVQTDNVTVGQVIDNRQVTDLPLSGRDFTNLLALSANVTQVSGGVTAAVNTRDHGLDDTFRNVSVNGSRPSAISFLVDGVTDNEDLFQAAAVIPPIDAIEEFKLQTSQYSAEFGMGAGQVNVALKSGTNNFHGSVWEFLRNNALQPLNPVTHLATPLRQNQFGIAGGGPVWLPKLYNGRNRTFFYGSYEGGRRTTSNVSVGQVPTAQEKQGNFSDWPTQLYNPLTSVAVPGSSGNVSRTAFTGNQIPLSMLAPQSLYLAQYYPAPNVTCNLPCNNYIRTYSSTIDTNTYTARVDHYIRESDRLFGEFLEEKQALDNPTLIPLSGSRETERTHLASIQWEHIFSPRILNDFHVGYNNLYFLSSYETSLGPVNYWQQAGFQNLRPGPLYNALPTVVLGSSYATVGTTGSVPFFNITNTFQFSETLTMTVSRHTLHMGADVRADLDKALTGSNGTGLLDFVGQYTAQNPTLVQTTGKPGTGNSFADFMLGYPNNNNTSAVAWQSLSTSGVFRPRHQEMGFYIQDDFRVNSQLTLNLGLRWEYHTPFHDVENGGYVFDTSYPGGRILYESQQFTQLYNNPILAGCCAPDPITPRRYNNFAPRVGIAWRPFSGNNKFVVRTGYGIFYDVFQNYYMAQNVTENVPYVNPALPIPTGREVTPPLNIRNLFPAPLSIVGRNFPPPYCQAPPVSVINAQGLTSTNNLCTGAGGIGYLGSTPYDEQWGINLQFEPVQGLLLETGYQGARGLHLPGYYFSDPAVLPPTVGNPNNGLTYVSQCPAGTYPSTCSPVQSRVPYQNFSAGSETTADYQKSWYNALTLKATQRFSHGLSAQAAFTWSKALDTDSETSNIGNGVPDFPQYGYDYSLEKGPSNFDQPRRFVLSALYELPFGRGKALMNRGGILNQVFGGWQANAIVTFADGTPVGMTCACGDRAQIGNPFTSEREDVTGNPLPPGFQQTYTHWFDTSVFVTPALGTLGNFGRNVLRDTAQHAVDFSMFKNFKVAEKVELQFRGEAFNVISSYFYTPVAPNTNPTQANFGSLLPVGGTRGNLFNPRIIQLALKVKF